MCAASAWIKWIKHIIDLKIRDAKEAKNVTNQIKNPKYEYGYELQTPYCNINDIRVFTFGAVIFDLLCYGGYKLGQYLDKDDANQETNSSKEKGKFENVSNNGKNGSHDVVSNSPKGTKS